MSRINILLLWVGLQVFASLTSHAEETVQIGGNDQSDVRPLFFQRLQEVAEQGDLFDPLATSKILGMDLRVASSEKVSDCLKNWQSRLRQTTEAIADSSAWYRVLPTGIRSMPVPAAYINPAMETGDAKFRYRVVRSVACTDRVRLQDSTEAELLFDGLPSFACITGRDIQRLLPRATFIMATDGVYLYSYQGKVDDDAGTEIKFLFRAGAQCALSTSIRKSQLEGLRYKRAYSKYRNCKVRTDREFCASHGAFDWGNGILLEQMSRYADEVCGTTDSLYKKDSGHGSQPEPLPKFKRGAPPCQMYDN
jgi:hypothetical protein